MLEIGTKCRVPGPNNPIGDRLALIRDGLQQGNVHPWLMIIDNADNPAIFSRSNDGSTMGVEVVLEQYVPDCDHGRILVTTTDLKAGRSLTRGIAPIQIERTTTTESITLLRNELGEAIGGRHWRDEDVARLATALDHLPLAMVQATSYIKENSMTIADYMTLIGEDPMAIRLLKYNFEEGERDRDPERPNAVYATWKLSIEQINDTNSNAAELLFVLAFMEQSNVPAFLLKPLVEEPFEFFSAVGALLRFSIIGSGSEDSYNNMHRIMQLSVKGWLTSNDTKDSYLKKALLLLSENFPVGGREKFDMCLACEPHAVKVLRAASTLDDVISARTTLQIKLSRYYLKSIRWTEAEAMARDACQSLEKAYSGKHEQTLQAKAHLAQILNEEDKYEEAEIVSRQVVDGTESLLGTKDKQTLEAYHFMATVYRLKAKLSQAEKAARKAFSGLEKTLGPTNPDIYRSQRSLATILELQGKYGAAEALINKAPEGQRALAGHSDEKNLHIQYRLAFIQRAQGHYAAAEEQVREAFEISRSVYGLSSLDTRKMQYSLALCLIAQSKIPEAEKHIPELRRFVNDQHHVDPDHRYRLLLHFALGLIKTAQGCHAEAVSLYQTAWKGIERSSPGRPERLEFRSAYTAALLELNVAVHAEESYSIQSDIYKTSKKEVGPDHPITLTSLLRLSEASAAKGDVKEAVKIAKRAKERREKILGKNHPDTVAAEAWLEQLQARKKSKVNVAADVAEDVGTTRDRGKSLGEEGNRDHARGFLGRWRRSSSGKAHVDDSTESLPTIGKEGGTGSENSDDDSYDELAKEKEGASAPDTNKPVTSAFAIRRKEMGKR